MFDRITRLDDRIQPSTAARQRWQEQVKPQGGGAGGRLLRGAQVHRRNRVRAGEPSGRCPALPCLANWRNARASSREL